MIQGSAEVYSAGTQMSNAELMRKLSAFGKSLKHVAMSRSLACEGVGPLDNLSLV